MPAATFEIAIYPGSDALHRIVCVCHRRSLSILELSYSRHEIKVTVEGDERRVRQLAYWMTALHDVVLVKGPGSRSADRRRTETRTPQERGQDWQHQHSEHI